MKRGPIIVIVFILVAAIVVGASQFLRSQPPLEFTVAVSPLAEAWVRGAVDSFNASSPLIDGTKRIHFNVQTIDDTNVWQGQSGWTTTNHPDAWIPAASVSVEYAANVPLPLRAVTPSLARTPLVWGGFSDRLDVLTHQGSVPFDWQTVEAAATSQGGSWSALGGTASWGFVKLAFPQPSQSMSGLAVLFSGAGAQANNPDLRTGNIVTTPAFQSWMRPVALAVPNFTTLGGDVAATMAARGTSVADIALLPESQWLNNLSALEKSSAPPTVSFSYPASQFIFDFPLARWDDSSVTADQRAAVDSLSAWLLAPAQQQAAIRVGLRPAQGEPDASAALFSQGLSAGIQLAPVYGQPVQPPTRNDTQRLLLWFASVAR